MQVKESKPIWEWLHSLADELKKRWEPDHPEVKWVHIKQIADPPGCDYNAVIHYVKKPKIQGVVLAPPVEDDLPLNHRDLCPWEDPKPG